MYNEDSFASSVRPVSKESLRSISLNRAAWLEDYLYLPSHITYSKRAEIKRKYGDAAFNIEKDVSLE